MAEAEGQRWVSLSTLGTTPAKLTSAYPSFMFKNKAEIIADGYSCLRIVALSVLLSYSATHYCVMIAVSSDKELRVANGVQMAKQLSWLLSKVSGYKL